MKLTAQQEKIAIGAGVGILTLGAVAFLLRSREAAAASPYSTAPIDTGIYVHPQCIDWSITNDEKFNLILQSVFNPLVEAGERNPWTLAYAMLQRVAPQCNFGGYPRNASEAYLIYIFVLDASFALENNGKVSNEEARSLRAQANAWALLNGVAEDKLYED